MTHGSLFSGIGGFDLAAQWMGWQNIFQVEIDPFCQKVLAKNFPGVQRFTDIKEFDGTQFAGKIDVLSGGFPCQDISVANPSGKGLEGERSGLWKEYARTIRGVMPRYVVIENSSNLVNRGLDAILRELGKIGYDAEWNCIPATHVGAYHQRDRVWIVAYAERMGRCARPIIEIGSGNKRPHDNSAYCGENGGELEKRWPVEPAVGRMAYGVPDRSHRLKSLGNAIVPQIAYEIFKAIEYADTR